MFCRMQHIRGIGAGVKSVHDEGARLFVYVTAHDAADLHARLARFKVVDSFRRKIESVFAHK